MIEVKNLSKNFGKQKVLLDINIQVKPGKVTAIVGENGAGKSTLFKCLAGLEQAKGSINLGPNLTKKQIGFLPTNPEFLSKITAQEYLQFVCNARGVKVKNIRSKNIFDLPLNRYASDFSTGMKKKLALTSLLLVENDFFILDEPFNGLDLQSNILFFEILDRLKQKGKTILLSSHIFNSIHETSDYLYYLKGGKIESEGNKDKFKEIETLIKSTIINGRLDTII
jgi:ABC-2 type transport system ATP-binding protein